MEKKYSILYAEDDEQVRKNYVLYLENYFEEIYQAKDGKEALSIYKDKKPDVLLLDITMPEVNGLDVAKTVRNTDQETPIIVLSAHSNKEFLFDAIKLSLVDYLIKPINRNEFKSVMVKTLDNLSSNEGPSEDDKVFVSRTCYWDKSKRLFFYRNKIVDLTKNERILFELLLNHKNEIVEPSQISGYVWDNESKINDASIRNLVKRLRKKLPVDIIQSIYGSGYILNY